MCISYRVKKSHSPASMSDIVHCTLTSWWLSTHCDFLKQVSKSPNHCTLQKVLFTHGWANQEQSLTPLEMFRYQMSSCFLLYFLFLIIWKFHNGTVAFIIPLQLHFETFKLWCLWKLPESFRGGSPHQLLKRQLLICPTSLQAARRQQICKEKRWREIGLIE